MYRWFGLLTLILIVSCLDTTKNHIRTVSGLPPIGPYIQNLSHHGVSILWTSLDRTSGKVLITDQQTGAIHAFRSDHSALHSITVSGLEPSRNYTYRVFENDKQIGSEGRFRTPDEATADSFSFSFAVLGDSGIASEAQYAIAHQMRLFSPDFILHTGDIVYPDGAEHRYYDRYFRPYEDLLGNVVVWTSPGNHDLDKGHAETYFKLFENPANNSDSLENYYSFEYGSALFISLDTTQNVDSDSQRDFLINQLKNSSHDWKFAFFHHPPYSSGTHGSDEAIRGAYSAIFEQYDVDIVFNGHEHSYERTQAMQDYHDDGHGTVYVVSGGGGKELREVGKSDFTAASESVFHFVGVRIQNQTLTLQSIDNEGKIFDSLSLQK